jgi:glycosyltransferase involved in cell wall biosynthesis
MRKRGEIHQAYNTERLVSHDYMNPDFPLTLAMPGLRQLSVSSGRQGWPWSFDEPPSGSRTEVTAWPRITIVTPSFNQGKFIEETIRSVLLQGYPNLEYVIIDGGSTDNTLEIIKEYEPWITYWVSEKDRGQCHAINKAFARATGDIFAWLCSDDVYAPGALHKVAEALRDRKMAMAIGDSVITHGPDSLAGKLDRRRPTFINMAYNTNTLAQPSVFWSKDLWDVAGPLNEDLYFLMDKDLWLRMIPASESIANIDLILSYQRTQPQQKSNSNHPQMIGYFQERVRVGYQAAQARGESTLGWLGRVWWYRLRYSRGRFWRLREPGFHWQALKSIFRRS